MRQIHSKRAYADREAERQRDGQRNAPLTHSLTHIPWLIVDVRKEKGERGKSVEAEVTVAFAFVFLSFIFLLDLKTFPCVLS